MWLKTSPLQGKSNVSSRHHKRGFSEHMSRYGKGCVPTQLGQEAFCPPHSEEIEVEKWVEIYFSTAYNGRTVEI